MYRKLTHAQAFVLKTPTLATLTTTYTVDCINKLAVDLPVVAIVIPSAKGVSVTFFDDSGKPVGLTIPEKGYGSAWWLSVPASFEVNTPHGTLVVSDGSYDEYPGVEVELAAKDTPDGQPITLVRVEYTPGGEGISDYDPKHPREMERQQSEVPLERREASGLFSEQEQVTAGFVTRAWPDEVHQQELHYRCFHYGYKRPWQSSEELKTMERRAWNALCEAETRYGRTSLEAQEARATWELAKRNLSFSE